jgi:predicted metal-dependent peptidase
MMGERIKVAQSEVFGVLRASGIQEVHYICADATVQVSKKIRLAQSIELKGGGGTDMALAMEEAAKTKCNLMIVLTDGETGWPEKPHGMDVMVVLCETGATAPSWAKSIHIGP